MNGTYYKHVLAAIDLSEDNRKVIEKAVDRARSNGAKLSVIHVDVDLKDLYTEMIDIDIDNVQDQVIAEAKEKLEAFLASVDYPIEKKLVQAQKEGRLPRKLALPELVAAALSQSILGKEEADKYMKEAGERYAAFVRARQAQLSMVNVCVSHAGWQAQ